MTPREKAIELFDKMLLDWGCNECHNHWAKECALIAIDEILSIRYLLKKETWFYKEVKKEIEKL